MIWFLCVLVVALVGDQSAPAQPADGLTAEQILQRVKDTYANCKTYRDKGLVKIRFIVGKGGWTQERPFATAFVRPERFRYEFTDKQVLLKTRYIVYRNGKDVRTWWELTKEVEKHESLSNGFAGACAITGGSALDVPGLLMPGEIGHSPLAWKSPQRSRLADETLGKAACYCLLQKGEDHDETALWIDKATHLILQTKEKTDLKEFKTETTTTYEPVLDKEVPEALLAFGAPSDKQRVAPPREVEPEEWTENEKKVVVSDYEPDKTGKHRLVLRNLEVSVERDEKSVRISYDFHSLAWEVKEEKGWKRKVLISRRNFERDAPGGRRWVSEIHSIDPEKGRAIIMVAEEKPTDARGSTEGSYSWREWDLNKNEEVRLIRVCKDPGEPYVKGGFPRIRRRP
jgi:hypothetical protein